MVNEFREGDRDPARKSSSFWCRLRRKLGAPRRRIESQARGRGSESGSVERDLETGLELMCRSRIRSLRFDSWLPAPSPVSSVFGLWFWGMVALKTGLGNPAE